MGDLSGPAFAVDAADAVRDLRHHLRAAAHRPGQHRRHLVRFRRHVDPAEKGKIEKELGLDKPITDAIRAWISGLAHGDLGYSYVSEKPALAEILPRIPITADSPAWRWRSRILFGVPLGVISAVKQNTSARLPVALAEPERAVDAGVLARALDPDGLREILRHDPDLYRSAERLLEHLWLYSVPAAAVGFRSSALIMRLTRSSMLEVLRQDYIRTARAKGAYRSNVNYQHALRNAMLPVVTVIGIEAAFLMGGLIVTETVFNIPGIARFLVEAIRWRDYPIVQNLVMFIAVIVVVDQFRWSTSSTRRSIRASSIRTDMQTNASMRRSRPAPGANVGGALECDDPFLARRYPLGAIGAAIMRAFVFAALFADLITFLRSARAPMRRSPWCRPAGCTGSAPTISAATSTAASCTARASRWRSASARPLLGCLFGVALGLPPATCRLGRSA